MRRDSHSRWHLSRPIENSGFGDLEAPEPGRALGELIQESTQLTAQQVEQIVAYQRQHRTRFGEAAIALKLVTREEVLKALSRQFQYTYTPALTGIEARSELVAATNPFGEAAEAFRELRSQLLMGVLGGHANAPHRALAVISAEVGDGKTYVAANLAVALSQLGGRTLLLDGDMRTPRIHEVCGISSTTGLSSILAGRADRKVIQPMKELTGLFVLPVGGTPPNPVELLQRPFFGLLLQELLKKFDHVIIDTPASMHGADAKVIAAAAGAALIVGRRNKSRTKAVEALATTISKGPIALAGIVINER